MAGYIQECKELKTLLSENPDLPLVFFTSEECGSMDYSWCSATAKANIADVFDDKTDFNEDKIYTDKDDLEEDLSDYLRDEYTKLTETELDEMLKEKLKEFEPMWKKCIVVWISPY